MNMSAMSSTQYVPSYTVCNQAHECTTEAPKNAKEFSLRTVVGDLFPSRGALIHVMQSNSIRDVYEVLIREGISSVPVYNVHKQRYISFVDVLDLVAYFITFIESADTTTESLSDLENLCDSCVVSEIANLSERNPFIPVQESTSLMIAIEKLYSTPAHRLPVIDAGGDLVTILTESQILELVWKHEELFRPFLRQSVDQLDIGTKDIISVHLDTPVVKAFSTIHNFKVSGSAVVNDDSTLVGSISATDIKYIGDLNSTNLSKLSDPVHKYMSNVDAKWGSGAIPPPLCVQGSTLMHDVLSKIVRCNVHRIYVVNDFKKPVAVISLSDILKSLSGFLRNDKA